MLNALRGCQSVKNYFCDRLTEVNKAAKTSNATPKCIQILERGALCSKSKRLAQQGLFAPHPSKIKDFCHLPPGGKALSVIHCYISHFDGWRFFDTLRTPAMLNALRGFCRRGGIICLPLVICG